MIDRLSSDNMGDWSLTVHSPAIIISSGVVAVQGKDDSATADFSLRYKWLIDRIAKSPKAAEYSMTKKSPVTLAKACQQNRLSDLGKLETITKTVDVKYSLKRCYYNIPKSGGELIKNKYNSIAWDISIVMDLK